MSDKAFVHLHTHSHFSLLDCTATLEDLVEAARNAGMKALAVTDHGNMFGAVEFYEKALQAGIKPIIGYEAYVAPDSRHSRQARGISDASFHLTLLARNLTGYRNLMHLATVAYTEGFYYRPRIDKEVLASHHEGLVCLSGCIAGELPHYLLVEDEARAVETAAFYSRKSRFAPATATRASRSRKCRPTSKLWRRSSPSTRRFPDGKSRHPASATCGICPRPRATI